MARLKDSQQGSNTEDRRSLHDRVGLNPLCLAIRALLAGGALLGVSSQNAGADPAMPLPRPEAAFASMGAASYVQDGTRGVINQTTDKAILNWKSFDIAPQHSVEFKQPSATSIALNRINELANPSQILGELKANGQVYLYNPNGFVFGSNSRVNVNTLVATTLDVADEAFERGVTKVYDYKNSGQQAFGTNTPNNGRISIEAGAQITTNAPNRRILIVAPTVENRGTVQADDGEVIMAAATDKLYLQEAPTTSSVSGLLVEVGKGGSVSNLGSVLARRGSITLAGFAVNQQGIVSATTSVRQNGTIRLLAREGGTAITDPNDNTKILLKQSGTYRTADSGDGLGQVARVTLGPNSVTQVQPELGDATTALDEQAQFKSKVEIYGKQVRFEGRAQVLAPSGDVSVTGEGLLNSAEDTAPRDTRIDMAAGSKIDVSGLTNITLPMESNVIPVELRLNELRDSPLQRAGVLRNKTIMVDVRKGTPLADITTSLQRIGRTIAERSTAGGSVTLNARGAVVVNPGAQINIAGGTVNYQGGYINTSQLITNGRLVDISQADPNLVYEGIFTGAVSKAYAKWNKTLTWWVPMPRQSRYEAGYTEGKEAGSLSIITEALKLDGLVNALTQAGVNQRTASTLPAGGSLSIDLSSKSGFVGQDVLLAANKTAAGAIAPDAAFPGFTPQNPNPDALVLSGDFQAKSGIAQATLKTAGKVEIDKGTAIVTPVSRVSGWTATVKNELGREVVRQLTLAEGYDALARGTLVKKSADISLPGGLSLTGGQILHEGSIDAAGGQVSLTTQVGSAAQASMDGSLVLDKGSRIDVGGNWVNDRLTPILAADYSKPAIPDAGAIKLSSQGDLSLAKNSELAADGGAWLKQNGSISYGKGGAISLESTAFGNLNGSNLTLDGSVHAYAAHQGGSLSLTTNEILIGQADSTNTEKGLAPLRLGNGFFATGGFGSFTLASNLNGVTLGSDAQLQLQAENVVLTGGFNRTPSARSLAGISRRTVLPADQRKPVDLTLVLHPPQNQFKPDSAVTLEAGSSIKTDPTGNVSIQSDANIHLAGSISAPAGTIDLTILAPDGQQFNPSQGLFLAGTASLDVQGTTQWTANRFGLKTGDVLPGGAVSLTAKRGYIVAAEGSSINASGVSALLNQPGPLHRGVTEESDVLSANDTIWPRIRIAPVAQSKQVTKVASNGGTIALTAAEGMLLNGELAARSGGDGAVGGSLAVELNTELRNPPESSNFPTGDRILELSQHGTANPLAGWSPGQAIPNSFNGLAQLAADTVEQGGFHSLSLKSISVKPEDLDPATKQQIDRGQIRFQGSVSLDLPGSVILDAPILSWGGGAGLAHIGAGYVAAGYSNKRQVYDPIQATAGGGTLELTGNLIDLFGATSLQGFGAAKLISQSDLRFRGVAPEIDKTTYAGEFQAAGNLTLQAVQVYPTTASTFAVNLTGADSLLQILRSGGTQYPLLSAGGDLSLKAADIVQAGNLQVPFGALNLTASRSIMLAPGSLTSVSGEGLFVPFGRTPGGLDWLYPVVGISSFGNVLSGDTNKVYLEPPEKSIAMNAPSINLESGATINIAGGGDLSAFEYVPGLGGSIDALNPSDPNVVNGKYPLVERYAILPSLKGGFSPYDPIEFASYVGTPSGLKIGDSVYLAGGGGLAAGEYPLLPAHYALLPGAFLLTQQTGTLQTGQQFAKPDGATVVAGYRTTMGTSANPADWSAFAVQPGSAANTLSEYQMQTASTFFDQQAAKQGIAAASSVNDAGRLSLSVTQELLLNAKILASSVNGGRGGQLDVVAPNIAVVSQRTNGRADGFVELVAGDLNQLGMESVVLGARRSKATAGTILNVSTGQVTVESGANLAGPEIILTATGQVTVQTGAEITGVGKQAKSAPQYLLDGDAALLRVASGSQAGYSHGSQTGATGDLTIQQGAILKADGSMLLDSSHNAQIDGRLAMQGGDLAIFAGLINLGQTPAGTGGTTLSDALLGGLDVDGLTLTGRDGINFYGALDLNLGKLTLDAPVFTGFNNPDARISAESIELANSSGKTAAKPVTGPGKLALNGGSLGFGPGAYAITGFDTVNLQGASDTRFAGTGRLDVAATTHLTTSQVSGSNGADFTLDASGFALGFDNAGSQSGGAGGLGTQFRAVANSIDVNTRFALPSGTASFTALQGDLNLLSHAQMDLAGLDIDFGLGGTVSTPGGLLNLQAKGGNIALQAGSAVRLGGAGGATAGGLSIAAANGTAVLDGSLDASGNGGSLSVDAQGFGAGGFSSVNALALAGGFDASLSVRQRSGDLRVGAGETVRASQIALSADGGSILLGGKLDASGMNPGEVILSADGQVVLDGGSSILATASGGKGGSVELSSNKSVAASDNDQGLWLKAGSLIDVSGAQGVGEVHLRAQRNDTDVSIAPIQATIAGAGAVIAEAVKTVDLPGSSQITAGQIASWKTDAANFMTRSAAISQALGGAKILPGLEIRSTGDLTLAQAWDLSTWRYSVNGESLPGFLTLRTGGNINLNNSLVDGLNPTADPAVGGATYGGFLRSDASWGLQLASGADFGGNAQSPQWSADWRQTQQDTGNLTLASGAVLRTGTGDIDIHAGGDITLTDQTSVIYTAGHRSTNLDPSTAADDPFGNLNIRFFSTAQNNVRGVEFPVEGGDIHISAGGNINGAVSTQFIPDWQRRVGSFQQYDSKGNLITEAMRADSSGAIFKDTNVASEMPTAWGIFYNYQANTNTFQQNIGALGGGNVTVSAGGDINNLQVMLPTTGKQIGTINTNLPSSVSTLNPAGLNRYITNVVQVNGGGNLSVTALGDINGGEFYVGQGSANINSFKSIMGGSQFSAGPLFVIGDAEFQVSAARDIAVGAAFNPSALAQRTTALARNTASTYFNYTDNSALQLNAMTGNIDFRMDTQVIADQYLQNRTSGSTVLSGSNVDAIKVLPGTLQATAIEGNITLDSSFHLFPTATGNLSFIAGGNIQSDPASGGVILNMSAVDPSLFPSQTYPKRDLSSLTTLLDTSVVNPLLLPATPLHINDPAYAVLMSRDGSINGHTNFNIYLPKPAFISAGKDILDIGLNLQNMRTTDVSLVETGGNVRYNINRGELGQLIPLKGFGIQAQGPGQLHVLAGGDIDLGASDGITTSGNLYNTALDETGASLTLMAGLKSKPDYEEFLEKYIGSSDIYQLDNLVNKEWGAGKPKDIKDLSEDQQRELALTVFFNELKLSTEEASVGKGYERGDLAIATLFHGDDYGGDIKLFFSRIHTLDGGNIDLLAPGGLINAGLASAFVGDKKPDQLGIVTQRGGAVLAYTQGDFQVNQSRVFAIAALPTDFTPRFTLTDAAGIDSEPYKDIIAWSAQGSIDAGRGSKGALSVSGGKKAFDQKGNLTEDVPPTIDGSGIRAQIRGSIDPGNVSLAAPKGIVDAGEAGIGGKGVTIAATAIVGATNIQTGSGGLSSNVATSPAPVVVAPASASSAAASASQMAEQSASSSASKKADSGEAKSDAKIKLSTLSAELLGAGEYSVNDIREGKHQGSSTAPEAAKEKPSEDEEKGKKKPVSN